MSNAAIPRPISVKDHATVRFKSANEWNEGHHLTGEVVAVDGNRIKVDLPFKDRVDGWYDLNDVVSVSYYYMDDKERERIHSSLKDYKKLDGDSKCALIADMLDTGEGRDMLAHILLSPVKEKLETPNGQ